MDYITIIGFVAAFCTTISFLPQVIKTIRTKQTKDLSLLMYSVLCFGMFMWLIYGILESSMPLILANSISFVLSVTVLIMKIRYG
jgi:MtN3 and saliva related transmembrane protein